MSARDAGFYYVNFARVCDKRKEHADYCRIHSRGRPGPMAPGLADRTGASLLQRRFHLFLSCLSRRTSRNENEQKILPGSPPILQFSQNGQHGLSSPFVGAALLRLRWRVLRYLIATASDSWGCQPPPSALNAATAARADSVCACARISEARSRFSSACKTSIRLTTPFWYAANEAPLARLSESTP